MLLLRKAHPATRTMIGGDPTPEQAMAGDYPKLRREWHGLTIAIEHPEGTVREGVDETGKPWRTVFRYAYGEILGTLGMDGDPVDVFIGSYPDAPEVYIVQQMKRKQWDVADEQKVMIDFSSLDEARAAYLAHYDDPRFFGGITAMPVDEFIAKVRATKEKPQMIKAIFLKTHVNAYTKKDGTFVAAHEDKRQKHSPEQIAKWAAEKQARERAQAEQREKDRQSEKKIYEKYADGVASTASGKDFTSDEIEAIRGYYMSGDKRGALAEGRNAAVAAIERNLRAAGVEIEHVSESQEGKSKSLYVKVDGEIVRVSDHELPETPERQANREAGRTGRWAREVIVSDWQGTSIAEYVNEIKGGNASNEKPAMIKSILFFKGFIGPYLRGGKMVNLKGYHSKKTKKVTASEGQSSLFADLEPPPEVKQTAKVARALTTWMQRHGGPAGMSRLLADMSPEHQEKLVDAMAAIGKTDAATVRAMMQANPAPLAQSAPDLFIEPQHTEPTRELIEEHERLVDVLNSPSHEDDKVEAKKQAEELAGYKEEAAAAKEPTKAQQTRARRKAVLDVLGEGWKADAGVDGAKDRYSKVFSKEDGGKLDVTIMPEKTVDGNFYVGSYHRGGKRRGAGSNGYAQTVEEAKSMAERFAGVGQTMTKSIVFLRQPS